MKNRKILAFALVASGLVTTACSGSSDSITDQEICEAVINNSAVIVKNDSSPVRDDSYGIKNTLNAMSGGYITAYTTFSYESDAGKIYTVEIDWEVSSSSWKVEEYDNYVQLKPIYPEFGTTAEATIKGTATYGEGSASLNYTVELNSNKLVTDIADMPTSGEVCVQGYVTGFIETDDETWYGITVQQGDYGFMIYNIKKNAVPAGLKIGDCIEVSGESSPYNNTRQIAGSSAVVTLLTGDDAAAVTPANTGELGSASLIGADTFGTVATISGVKVLEAEVVANVYEGSVTEWGYVQAKVLYKGQEMYIYSDRYNQEYDKKEELYNLLKDACDNNETKTLTFRGMQSQGKWAALSEDGTSTSYSQVNPALMFIGLEGCEVVDGAYEEVEQLSVTYNGSSYVGSKGSLTVKGSEAAGTEFTYSSSNTSVVTVDGTGYVNCVGTGSAVITVTSVANPAITGVIRIKVEERIGEIPYAIKSVSEVLAVEYTVDQAYVVTGKIVGFGNSGEDSTINKYGSMVIADLEDPSKTILCYGVSPIYADLSYENGEYKYDGSYVADTHANTKDLKVGDTISLTAIRADYKGTPQLEGIVAAVNYEMVNEPTPATLAEVMSYSDVLNDSSKINAQRVYEITVTIDSWEDGETDGTEYGNFYVTDEDGNKCFVYGATAQTGAISYNYKGSSCYSMGNKKDWLTNDVTKDLTIGDKITMTVVRADYNGTIQIVGENVRKAV